MEELLSRTHEPNALATVSLVKRWAIRGPPERKLAHLSTIFPPLMTILAATSGVMVLVIMLVILKLAIPLGIFVLIPLLAFPFYRAADAFEMYLLSGAAENADPSSLSREDTVWLARGKEILGEGRLYFGRLALLVLLVMSTILIVQPLTGGAYQWVGAELSTSLMSLFLLGLAILIGTLWTYGSRSFKMGQEPALDLG